MDRQVRAYLIALGANGAIVNTATAIGCAKDNNLPAANGRHIGLTKHWRKNLLSHMGFVKRRPSTKSKVAVQNFKELKAEFLLDIKTVVEKVKSPFDLIINWDKTGIHYVPVGS